MASSLVEGRFVKAPLVTLHLHMNFLPKSHP